MFAIYFYKTLLKIFTFSGIPDTVKNYLSSNNINLKVLLDQDGSVTQTYGVSGFPNTFIINEDGSLYTFISGDTDKETLLKILDKIKKGERAQ